MSRLLLLMTVLLLSLQAGVYDPLTKAQGDAKIYDIGEMDTADISMYAPKIWSQYPGLYLPFEGVNMYARLQSDPASCIIDEYGIESCPLLAQACDDDAEYTAGSSNKVTTYVRVATRCPSGTTYNTTKKRCEAKSWDVCQAYPGYSYSTSKDQCVKSVSYRHYFALGRCRTRGYAATMMYLGTTPKAPSNLICVDALSSDVCSRTSPSKCKWVQGSTYATESPQKTSQAKDWILYAYTKNVLWGDNEKFYDSYGLKPFYNRWTSSPPLEYATVNGWSMLRSSATTKTYTKAPTCPASAKTRDKNRCYTTTTCLSGYKKISATTCQQWYSYYTYSCPSGENSFGQPWVGPVDGGTNCLGACPGGRMERCVCNSATPPVKNCSRQGFSCPIDEGIPCVDRSSDSETKRLLEKHPVTGDELVGDVFGTYYEGGCGEECDQAVAKITGEADQLCFEKRNGLKACSKVEGCTFEGSIDAGEGHSLGAIWSHHSGDVLLAQREDGSPIYDEISSTCTLNGAVGFTGRGSPVVATDLGDERIEFWSQYEEEGYLGFLEFVRGVQADDAAEGYELASDIPWQIKSDGFNRIESHLDKTFAISQGAMTAQECQAKASKFGFTLFPPLPGKLVGESDHVYELVMNATGGYYNSSTDYLSTMSITSCEGGWLYDAQSDSCLQSYPAIESTEGELLCVDGGELYDERCLLSTPIACKDPAAVRIGRECTTPVTSERRCVIVKEDGLASDFSSVRFSVKDEDEGSTGFTCSALTCDTSHSCQYDECPPGTSGTLLADGYEEPLPAECVEQQCDARLPSYDFCGKGGECPITTPGIYQTDAGCVRVECPEGGLDSSTGECFKWQCPEDYLEEGGRCAK